MSLEHFIIFGLFFFGIGLAGVMVKRESSLILSSLFIMVSALIVILIGFSLFWMKSEAVIAAFVILVLFVLQSLVSFSLFGGSGDRK